MTDIPVYEYFGETMSYSSRRVLIGIDGADRYGCIAGSGQGDTEHESCFFGPCGAAPGLQSIDLILRMIRMLGCCEIDQLEIINQFRSLRDFLRMAGDKDLSQAELARLRELAQQHLQTISNDKAEYNKMEEKRKQELAREARRRETAREYTQVDTERMSEKGARLRTAEGDRICA